jgi:hypothetical protein
VKLAAHFTGHAFLPRDPRGKKQVNHAGRVIFFIWVLIQVRHTVKV